MLPLDDIGRLLVKAAERHGSCTALICLDRTLSFSELNDLADRFARGLRDLGIKPGERVTLWLENGWRWVVAYFGLFKAGAVANPVNLLLTPDEVDFIIANCGARAVVGDSSKLRSLSANSELLRIFTDLEYPDGLHRDGARSFNQLIKSDLLDRSTLDSLGEETTGDRIAAVCYTSGTTGRPKGAVLTHRNILHNVAMTSLMHGRCKDDVIVSALPCTHVYGNVVMNGAIGNGSTLVLFPKFEARAVLNAIEEHRCTLLEGVPTMYYYLLRERLEQRVLSSLRMCTVGGQAIPESTIAEVERRFGCPLIELWGMTEMAGLGTTHPHTGPYRHGSIGIGLPFVETKIVPLDHETDCAPGTIGELMVRGPVVMKGYWRDEAATAKAITSDRWLHTGDVASVDADGFIRIVDRLSDMILTAGYNVYPAEIERVVASHPAVAMVAVCRLPDTLKGEIAKAYVVLKAESSLGVDELLTFCRSRLAAYKVPRAIQFVADLPKTSTGKIMRRALASLDDT